MLTLWAPVSKRSKFGQRSQETSYISHVEIYMISQQTIQIMLQLTFIHVVIKSSPMQKVYKGARWKLDMNPIFPSKLAIKWNSVKRYLLDHNSYRSYVLYLGTNN